MMRVKITELDFTLLTGHVSITPSKIHLLQQLYKPNCLTLCTDMQNGMKDILATQVFINPRHHKKICPKHLNVSLLPLFQQSDKHLELPPGLNPLLPCSILLWAQPY